MYLIILKKNKYFLVPILLLFKFVYLQFFKNTSKLSSKQNKKKYIMQKRKRCNYFNLLRVYYILKQIFEKHVFVLIMIIEIAFQIKTLLINYEISPTLR